MEKVFKFISNLFKDNDPIIIMPFGGYANDTHIFSQARVLEDEGIEDKEDRGCIRNVYNSYKRFETDEIPDSNVKVLIDKKKIADLHSDKEGYIYLESPHNLELINQNKNQWIPVTYQLYLNNKPDFKVVDYVLYPSKDASYGIITDMDETVIETGLTSRFKWKVIVNSFFKHSNARLPLQGVQEFYQKLSKGSTGGKENPFFYLSNSPWNLHEYLTRFLAYHHFPKGPLLLRDIGFENKRKSSFLERNKFLKISHILNAYPYLPFILIGDAVDIDSEIYIEVAKQFPNRIKVIYIRTVNDKKKMEVIEKLIENNTHVEVKLIKNTEEAIEHAAKNNLITTV
ncbi:App1 family protein [Tenacibaculum sp. IB213877]|uniref:App1 family protein n=1 Tax=Tenacibaculum sp. IB213877 TaxID=3097351 RepID=UPI002A59E5FC|nr:phosphatase domain-containing protein [Tenacibaculum sp. IB213877]MDY0779332.1 phosphatase domain-containing protein [Tenacibaculum sp. IB213877]